MSNTNAIPSNQTSYRYVSAFLAFATQVGLAMTLGMLSPLGPYIREALNMNFTQFGLLFTFANGGTMVMLWITGPLVDKFGVRKVLLTGLIAMGFVIFIAGRTNAAVQLMGMELLVGITQSVAGPTGTKMVSTWFDSKERGTMLGVKQAGIPVASIIAGAVLPSICAAVGWRGAFNAVSVLLFALAVITALLYRDSDVMKEMLANNQSASRTRLRDVAGDVFTKDQILLAVGCMLLMGAQFVVSSNMSNYLSANALASLGDNARIVAGSVYSIACVAGVIGRVVFGMIADKKKAPKQTIMGMNVFAVIILFVIAFKGTTLSTTGAYVIFFLYGLTAFAFTGIQLALAADLTTMRAIGSAASFTLSLGFAGMMIMPPIFGAVVDANGFTAGYIFLAIASIVGLAILIPIQGKKVAE